MSLVSRDLACYTCSRVFKNWTDEKIVSLTGAAVILLSILDLDTFLFTVKRVLFSGFFLRGCMFIAMFMPHS